MNVIRKLFIAGVAMVIALFAFGFVTALLVKKDTAPQREDYTAVVGKAQARLQAVDRLQISATSSNADFNRAIAENSGARDVLNETTPPKALVPAHRHMLEVVKLQRQSLLAMRNLPTAAARAKWEKSPTGQRLIRRQAAEGAALTKLASGI